MSGIVALFNMTGAPVERSVLECLTRRLKPRGPDAQRSCVVGQVGLGHALLATTDRAHEVTQPASLDGRFSITADLRIDARTELIGELDVNADLADATDPELVLYAYRQWGAACVDHLLGDFAFIIWDAREHTLFCARDPLGVKLLYHACVGQRVVISNTLSCVRAHIGVSDRLNELVIGDFLVTGMNQDPAATTFTDVMRLPPSHTLCCSERGTLRTTPYYALPERVEPLRYADERDYIDHFRSLLAAAVGDRLRAGRATVSMSGGLDSTMLAAVAKRLLRDAHQQPVLHAYTHVFEHLIPHDERYHAAMAASWLGIPIRYSAADAFFASWHWLQTCAAPEPMSQYAAAHLNACCSDIGEHGRVVLTGYDGDALLSFSLAVHWRERLKRLEPGMLLRELSWHVKRRHLPRLGLRSAIRRWSRRHAFGEEVSYPPWLNPVLQRALRGRSPPCIGSVRRGCDARAATLDQLTSPTLRATLEDMDPGVSGLPVEYRHPLLDLRLIRFCLALPPHPWCYDKLLFRSAMQDELPQAVVNRPKTPLSENPRAAGLAHRDFMPPGAWRSGSELARFVDVRRYRRALEMMPQDDRARAALAWPLTSALALDVWLKGPQRRVPAIEGVSR
jgi:asparagine synthase (glutamine-hydrolysing)